MFRSIGGRLFLSYLGVVAVGLFAASITLSSVLVQYENDSLRLRLQELSAPLLTAMATALRNNQQPKDIVDTLAEQARSADARLLIITNNRRILVDGDDRMTGQTLERPAQGNFGTFSDGGQSWLYVQQVFRQNATGLAPAIIVVARPRAAF